MTKKRASLLGGVVLSLAAIGVFSLAVSVTEGQPNEGRLILDVELVGGSFQTPAGIPGPFNVEGTIVGGGTFQCWGWILTEDGITNVSQVYDIDGRGALMTQGRDGGPLAVVGGTGDFLNVRGEAIQDSTGPGFDFTMTFELRGAGR